MTSRKARPGRVVRRSGNGELFDTVEGGPVTLDFVADLVWLGENVFIFDEVTREDQTEAVLAPAIFARLRGDGASPLTVEGVALARAIMALMDMRTEFEGVRAEFGRMHERMAGLETLLRGAVRSPVDVSSSTTEKDATRLPGSRQDPVRLTKSGTS